MQSQPLSTDSSAADRDFTETLVTAATQRVWLPRWLYESLPYIYVLGGTIALASSIFNRHWTWILPHLLLLGCFLIHGGIAVGRLRQRRRKQEKTS